MIDRIYGNKFQLTCNNCGNGDEFDSWAEVLDFLKTEDWITKIVNKEYYHYCSDCKNE